MTMVDMYHPALGNVHVLADSSAVSLYEAHGWVLSSGSGPTPDPIDLTPALGDVRYAKLSDIPTPGTATGDALRAAFVPKWKANTAYSAGEPVLNPSGQTVTANTSFTSGSSYNASNWTIVSGGGGGGLQPANNLSDVASVSTARTNLGLGTAATQPTSAFDAAGAASAAVAGLAPLASPALTGTPTINGKPAKAVKFHNTLNPMASFGQYSSGRITCGVDAALGKVWSFNSGGVYQVDALTSTAWSALTLPTNINPSGQEAKILTYTPPSGANAGTKLMFLLSWNTSTSRYEIYSAVPGLKTVAPTWSSLLQQFPANAIMIPHAFRATSGAIFAGTYTGTPDITGGPVLYRSVDGITWSAVLSPGTTTRHCHGVYEDPFNPGTIYSTWGDYINPYSPAFAVYKSTDSGATWTGVSTLTSNTWQAVAMGFTADWIWFLSDQSTGAGPYVCDRATMTPRWATTKSRQDNIAVPMGIGGRQIADAVFNATTTITSATAAFTSADVGRAVMGNNSIPLGAYIVSVTNSTTAVISAAATSSQSAQPLIIGGDQFYAVAYTGAVDPTSGWLYLVANDASNFGNVAGIFVLTGLDEPMTLLRTLPLANIGHHEVFIGGGYLWIDRYGPMPLLTAA